MTFALSVPLAAVLAGGALAAPQPEGDVQVVTSNVYLHAATAEPWGSADTDDAMDAAFGPDLWEEEYFETVNVGTGAGGLFAPSVNFVFLDGSDDGPEELETFLAANQAALEAFVDRGGRLFVNSAPNAGDGTIDYDGRQIVDGPNSEFVVAANPSHPIFNGPLAPVGTAFTGGSFAHAVVTGPGLTPLILRTLGDVEGAPGDPSTVVLAEYRSGAGLTLLGGMTLPEHQGPAPNAANLWSNVMSYAARADLTAPTATSSGCASPSQIGVVVADPGGSGPASVLYAIDGGAQQSVATDASGNARIAVTTGSHTVTFRGVDVAGNVQATAATVVATCTKPPDVQRPKLKLKGFPQSCVTKAFRFRVTATDVVGITRVVVRRDGKRIGLRSL